MMRSSINKSWQFFKYFIFARKIWSWPRQSEVLIFDASDQDTLLEYLQPWHPEVLHVRGEQINMLVFLASLFKREKKLDAYINHFIERVSPRLIVTFIDNNTKFYSFSVRHKNLKTMFIQNGIRSSDGFKELGSESVAGGSIRVDHMMTFGSHIGAKYANYIPGTIAPIGSIKNNLVPRRHARKPGTIAFVSQYRNAKVVEMRGKYYDREEFFERADQLVLTFLMKYAERHGKKFFIIPCAGLHGKNDWKEEVNYYNELLGRICQFSNGKDLYAGYDAVDSAEVVVGIDSTLAYESAARGNKTAIFSIRSKLLRTDDRTFGWPGVYPDEGPFWTNLPDPEIFERILDHLFAINDEQWQAELTDHGFGNIMVYDPGNSILQTVLKNKLGAQYHAATP